MLFGSSGYLMLLWNFFGMISLEVRSTGIAAAAAMITAVVS
jgi:hypothetical protein